MNNSVLLTKVIEGLFHVAGRRTLVSFSIEVIKTVIKKLESQYDFFRHVEIEDALYSEGGIRVTTDHIVDGVDPVRLGQALDTLIRVVYIDLLESVGEDVGLFFIHELKEKLGEQVVEELSTYGLNFDQIQTEQHQLYRQMEKKPFRRPSIDKPEDHRKIDYNWDTVSTWKYDNNVCLLYDGKGTLLDTIQLDLIIEDYVRRVTEFKESTPKTSTMGKVTEKEEQLLDMLRLQDIDIDSALNLLQVSKQKLNVIIAKLLQMEMLQYSSDTEVKITEKGIQYIAEKQFSK
ncbi:MAG: hypothetical protein V1726_06625 [Methanobacteriota archaeon]